MDANRFVRVIKQSTGIGGGIEVWVDRATGVQYMFCRDGSAGGLSVLLGADGKPLLAEWGTEGK